jgi:hypothetical protein
MASYPTSLAQFLVYQDQPGDANHMLTSGLDPNTGLPVTTDLTIDSAHITDQIHQEVIAIEQTIGVRPFTVPSKTTIGASVVWLYQNKAARTHSHNHRYLLDLGADDHHQYPRADGSRGFSAPVTSPPARGAHNLVNLGQVQGTGVTASQMQGYVTAELDQNTVRGRPGQALRIQGGQTWGGSDNNGNLTVYFDPPFTALMSFVYMKLPFPGGSMLGWYAFQYMEDQLILQALTNSYAIIQFIEDIRVDARALVALAWMAIGI